MEQPHFKHPDITPRVFQHEEFDELLVKAMQQHAVQSIEQRLEYWYDQSFLDQYENNVLTPQITREYFESVCERNSQLWYQIEPESGGPFINVSIGQTPIRLSGTPALN